MGSTREEITKYHLSMGQEISEVELNQATKKKRIHNLFGCMV